MATGFVKTLFFMLMLNLIFGVIAQVQSGDYSNTNIIKYESNALEQANDDMSNTDNLFNTIVSGTTSFLDLEVANGFKMIGYLATTIGKGFISSFAYTFGNDRYDQITLIEEVILRMVFLVQLILNILLGLVLFNAIRNKNYG